VILLIPADPLRPRRPDEHFAAEADAARALGIEIALVDHDALTRPDRAEQATSRVRATGEGCYRGWMLRSEQYAAFEHALRQRGVALRTGHAQYRQAHELPGWYPTLAAVTPLSVWTHRGIA
jgi:hypothetical protein